MAMTHSHAKGQGQRSLGSKVGAETDGRIDEQTMATALSILTSSVNYDMTYVIHKKTEKQFDKSDNNIAVYRSYVKLETII